jgi:hypothetical protein
VSDLSTLPPEQLKQDLADLNNNKAVFENILRVIANYQFKGLECEAAMQMLQTMNSLLEQTMKSIDQVEFELKKREESNVPVSN